MNIVFVGSKEEKVASNNGGGFALQDQDQWK